MTEMQKYQRDELRNAGRLGNGRFEGAENHYARHIANPDRIFVIMDRIGKVKPFGGMAVVMRVPGPEDDGWYSGEIIEEDGRQLACAVNEYASQTEAQNDAERRVRR